MKLLFCGQCGDIKSFSETEFTSCKCGNMLAKWKDGAKGTVECKAINKDRIRFIGLNNQFLYKSLQLPKDRLCFSFKEWQEFHNQATEAPGYLFDKSIRGCWACVVGLGETNDIFYLGDI